MTADHAQQEIAALRQQVADLSREVAELTPLRERISALESQLNQGSDVSPWRTLAYVMDTLPMRIGWKDRNSVFVGANPAFVRSFGFASADQLIGKTDADFTSPDIAAAYRADDQRIMETGVPKVHFEERKQNQDGTLGWFLTSKLPVRDNTNNVIGVVVIIDDITARKQAEYDQQQIQEHTISAQQAVIRELATPLIPLADNVVIMPLIGTMDSRRSQQVLETLLEGIVAHQATMAILDITGVHVVDTQVAQSLLRVAQAAKLLGAQIILTGIGAGIAQTLSTLGADLRNIVTLANLQGGITYALRETTQDGR